MIKRKGKKGKLSLFIIIVLLFSLVASSLVMAETIDDNSQMDAIDTQAEETLLEESEDEPEVEPEEELGEESEIDEDEGLKVVLEKQGETKETIEEEIEEEVEEESKEKAEDISYKIDGENKESFIVDHDSDRTPRSDIDIEVTSELFDEATPDDPLIRVSKTFSGLTQEQIDQLTNFKITLTSQSDPTRTRNLSLNQGTIYHEENGDKTYKWEIEGWPAGTYIIDESGEELENYEVVIENDGTVTTEPATMAWDINIDKVTATDQEGIYHLKDGNGIAANLVAAKLTGNKGIFVWTETRLSASQRLAVINALSSWNELGLKSNSDGTDNGNWYSGEDDIAGNNFYFRGYQIKYNLDEGILNIPQSNQFSIIVTGAYSTEGGGPADIAVKNTYTLNTLDVTIEKEVTGSFGDLTREFDFTVIANEDENNSYEFKLSHGDDPYVIENLPASAALTLRENNANGYEVTVMVGEVEITDDDEDGEYIIDLSEYDSEITITVINHKDVHIDTGISLDSLPYILILTITMGGLGVTIIRRRNAHSQD